VVFRDEFVSPIAILGVVLVIAGAILASRSEVSLKPLPAEAP
jgi:drug/metabolite transporter (DMT)-like permease